MSAAWVFCLSVLESTLHPRPCVLSPSLLGSAVRVIFRPLVVASPGSSLSLIPGTTLCLDAAGY